MSDQTASPQPAPLLSVLGVFACFALFLLLVYVSYLPRQTGPFVGDGVRTPAERAAKLAELRATEQKHSQSYAWIDQSAGTVQLPIDRAMELTVQQYNSTR